MADRGPALTQYRRIVAAQRTATARAFLATWDALPTIDNETFEAFASRLAAQVAGARSATVATTSAFYAHLLEVPPVGVPADLVDSAPNLRDPFTTTWKALGDGHPYDEALLMGRSVVEAVARDFVQSTSRRTGDVFAARSGLTLRWERVAEPGACDWCRDRDGGIYLSAAEGDYGHGRCNCDVVPAEGQARQRESATDRADRLARQQRTQIQGRIRAARARQEAARLGQLTETNPARRERLSQREQQHETAVERLVEQLARL